MLKTILFLSLVAFAACGLLGGYEDADVDSEEVVAAANHAAQSLSKQFSSSYHHKLVKIVKAKSQIVAGTNYQLDVIVGLTNCKKAEVEYHQLEDCDIQVSISAYKKCQVIVFESLSGEHKLVSSGCILASKKDL